MPGFACWRPERLSRSGGRQTVKRLIDRTTATPRLRRNTRIIDYAGEKVSNRESLVRERRYIQHGHIWCFKLTNRTVIDAGVGGNIARFINHSCRPNCYIDIKDGVIWIRAARTIRNGEELTYDYNTDGED